MSTTPPAPNPAPVTQPLSRLARLGRLAGLLIVAAFVAVGWLILTMYRDNVSNTEWSWYIVLSLLGLGAAVFRRVRAERDKKPFLIGGFLLLVAILMATQWPVFDGEWHLLKWLALAAMALAVILLIFKGIAAALVAAAVALVMASLAMAIPTSVAPLNLAATPTTSTTSVPTTATTTQVCTYGLADGWKENPSYQVIVGGLSGDPVKDKVRMLEQADKNPVFVSGYALEKGLKGTDLNAENLRNGNCWTKEGRELATKVAGIIESSKVTLGEASKNDTNTGGHNGRLVRNETPGITGDRRAIVLTHPDGTKTVVLIRCGNFVYQVVPAGIPAGPTDETPVKQRPTAQPPGTSSPPATTTPPRLNPKNPAKDPARQGNVPPQVRGTAPAPAPSATAPAVQRPAPTYRYTPAPPPPPATTAPGATPRPTTLPAPVPVVPTHPLQPPFTSAPPPPSGW